MDIPTRILAIVLFGVVGTVCPGDPDGSENCPSLPDPPGDNVVNLGDRGLQPGDAIGPALDRWFKDGNEVRIPEGTYQWHRRFVAIGVAEASIVGEGEVIWKRPDGATHGVNLGAADGAVEVRNIDIKGVTEHRSFRVFAKTSDAKVTLRDVEIPDGGRQADGKNPVGMFVPTSHAGKLHVIDCLVQGFPNNGLYASAPGQSGSANGSVHVVRGLFKNNNIAGVRIGSDDSSVRGTVVVQTSSNGGNHRGIWLRETARNMRVKNVHIVQELGAVPFLATPSDRGGSATLQNVYIRNETGAEAMQIKRDIDLTGDNIHITGSGNDGIVDTTNASLKNVCRGESCVEPKTTKPSRCP